MFTFREQKTEELQLKQNVFESKMDRLQQECSSLRQANSLLEAQTKQLETASQEKIARLNSERDDQLKEKSKQIRQLKTQRDTLYEELRGVSQQAATDRFGQQSEKTRTEAKRRPFHFEPTDYQRLQTSDKLPRTIHASSQINPFSETLSPKQNKAAYSRSSFSDVDEEQQKLDELEALALEALNDI